MRGTGYAIGEILIFLAIAAIIGFLLGWVVFYRRRPSTPQPAGAPGAVTEVEKRTKSLQSKLDYVEKRTNAVLGALERSPAAKERQKAAAVAKQAEQAKAEEKQPAGAPAKDKQAQPATAAEKPPAAEAKPAPDKQAATKAAPDTQAADKQAQPKPAQDKKVEDKPLEPTGDESLDEYLSEADERIHHLEDTLDKLSEKLAELEE